MVGLFFIKKKRKRKKRHTNEKTLNGMKDVGIGF